MLEIIKKYDPEEYEALTERCDATIVEEHMDHLSASFPTLEEFEEAMKKTQEELAELNNKTGSNEQ